MDIKQQIIEKVNCIDDPAVLNTVLEVVNYSSEKERVYHPTPEENAAIEAGLRDIENGDVISQEEMDEFVSKWLKELSDGLKEPSTK